MASTASAATPIHAPCTPCHGSRKEARDHRDHDRQAKLLGAAHRSEHGTLQREAVAADRGRVVAAKHANDGDERRCEQHRMQRQRGDQPAGEVEPRARFRRQQSVQEDPHGRAREEQPGHLTEAHERRDREARSGAPTRRVAERFGDLAHHRRRQRRAAGRVGQRRRHGCADEREREASARVRRRLASERLQREPIEQAGVAHRHADCKHREHQHPGLRAERLRARRAASRRRRRPTRRAARARRPLPAAPRWQTGWPPR